LHTANLTVELTMGGRVLDRVLLDRVLLVVGVMGIGSRSTSPQGNIIIIIISAGL
jgi:hypothetical protein